MKNYQITFILIFIFSGLSFKNNNLIILEDTPVENEILVSRSSCSDSLPSTVLLNTSVDTSNNFNNSLEDAVASDAGITSGNLTVTPTGASSYSIPIANLPAIKNIVPNIALNYNSQAGNGIAGWGWNISGISTITRIATTKYHDGYIDPVDFDKFDRFALDGQRLMLRSGIYGNDNSMYETENFSNLKIKAFGISPDGPQYGPEYFIVYHPDGSRAWYGTLGNSRNRLEWSIFKIEDPQGNYIRYEYSELNKLLRIKKIKYGSRIGTVAPNEITFFYKERTRPEMFYIAGQQFLRTDILDKIEVKGNIALHRKYQLHHQSHSGYDRLTRLQEFNGVNGSFEAIRFEYPNSVFSLRKISSNPNSVFPAFSGDYNNIVSGDYNGDGKLDIIKYNRIIRDKFTVYDQLYNPTGSTTGLPVNSGRFDAIITGTFMNNDHKILSGNCFNIIKETVINNSSRSTVEFKSMYLLSTGLVSYQRTWNAPTDSEGQERKKIPKKYFSGDFNGDGVIDVLAIDQPYTIRQCPNPLTCPPETVNDPIVHLIDLNRSKANDYVVKAGDLISHIGTNDRFVVADFNGDGKSDLFHFQTGKVRIYHLNSEQQLTTINFTTDSGIDLKKPILLGDYNGDNKADFIIPTKKDDDLWRFYISRGINIHMYNDETYFPYKENFASEDTKVYEEGVQAPYVEYHYLAQDLNGDRKSDILVHKVVTSSLSDTRSVERIKVYSSQLKKGETRISFRSPASIKSSYNKVKKRGYPIFLEADLGNDNLEYGYISGSDIFAYQSGKNISSDMLLTEITNNTLVQKVDYGALDHNIQPSSYRASYEDSYPFMNINVAPSYKLVKKITENAGSSIRREKRFFYEGATTHLLGRGFIGFRILKQTDWDGDGVSTIWNISKQNPQLRGAVETSWSSLSFSSNPNGFITKTDYEYINGVNSNKIYKVLPKTIITENAVTGVKSTQFISYDSFSNILKNETTFPRGSIVVNYTYINDPSSFDRNYHIGRLTKKIESSTQFGNTFRTEEQYTYEENLLVKILKRSNSSPWLKEEFSHDTFGNVISRTISGLGIHPRIRSFKFDRSGRFLTESVNVEGLTTKFSFNSSNGNLREQTNPYGQKTTYKYDGWNRVISKTNYLDKTIRTTYEKGTGDSEFMVISTDYQQGQDAKTYVNVLGWTTKKRKLSLYNKWITENQMEYDILGRPIRIYEPSFQTPSQVNTLDYDAYGRIISQKLHTGQVIISSYNELTTTVNDGTKSVTTTKDAADNIIEVNDPGGTVSYTYFGNGAPKSVNYSGHRIEMEIDEWGRKSRLHDPAAGVYTYTYNLLGEVISETTPKGSTQNRYDRYGKIRETKIEGDQTNYNISYSYDPTSKKLAVMRAWDAIFDKSFIYSYKYDADQRLIQETEKTETARFEKLYTYDSYGRINRETYKSASAGHGSEVVVQHRYDIFSGMFRAIADVKTGNELWRISSLDQREQILETNYANKVKQLAAYDAQGFPEKIEARQTDDDSKIMQLTYSFDTKRGILRNRINHNAGVTENFSYDALNRLTGINNDGGKNKIYNANGTINYNPNLGNYNYLPGNRYRLQELELNQKGDQFYTRFANQQVTYNADKKPVSIYQQNGGRVDFEYGPMMNRTQAFYGGLDEDKNERRYRKQYSSIAPIEIIQDTDNNSSKIITYIGGDAYSAPVAYIDKRRDGDIKDFFYLHRDYLGSIIAISNNEGLAEETRHFGAWGTVDRFWSRDNRTVYNHDALLDRGFTGHEHFIEVNLIHMNGRMYDPHLRRFLSPDNFVQDPYNTQSFNRFGYVWNNPLSYNDPSGEIAFAPILIGIGVAAILHTGMHLATNDFTFQNWNWGAFVGSVAGGAVGGGVSSALTSAGLGGFIGGAITGGSSGFTQSFVSGLANNNLSASGLAKSTLIGAGIGGTVQGVGAAIDGRRFWDGAKVEYQVLIEDADLVHIRQNGSENCNCATGEMAVKSQGGKLTQDNIRQTYGGDPNLHGTEDRVVMKQISRKANLPIEFADKNVLHGASSKSSHVTNSLSKNRSVVISIYNNNSGHSVAVKGVYTKVVTKVNGSIQNSIAFKIFDPNGQQYFWSSDELNRRAINIFSLGK